VIALDPGSGALGCASRLPLNNSHELSVGVDSLADIILFISMNCR
jgi:hypothetical protein